MEEITIIGSLDQPLPTANSISSIYDDVDSVIEECLATKDPTKAIELGKSYIRDVQLKGVGLAKLLYRLYEEWEKFGLGEPFKDRIEVEWGLHRGTINQYISIMDEVLDNHDIPEEVRRRLSEHNVRTLKRLVRPAREEEFTEGMWREVSTLPDYSSVAEYVDNAMGKSSRGRPSITYKLYPDGSLYAISGGDMVLLAIFRNTREDRKNRLRRRANDKIFSAIGVQE